MNNEQVIQEKSFEEFQDTGLLMFINSFLHIFGWVICYDPEKKSLYPARTIYRGFSEASQEKNYLKITEYMAKEASQLLEQIKSDK